MVVVAGRSLADRFPDVAAEWHPTLNDGLTPAEVAPFSSKRAGWLCARCGRVWRAPVAGRTRDGKGCSTCRPPGWSQVAIRIGAELATLFEVGDLETSGREVRREIGWEPDIVIPNHRIAIDVGGRFWHGDSTHRTRGSRDRDLRKIEVFRAAGWRLIRIREAPLALLGADDVVVDDLRDTKAVTVAVAQHLIEHLGLKTTGLNAYRVSGGLEGGEVADILIGRYQRGAVAGRSFAELCPELAAEWHPTLNGVLLPESVFAGSATKAWWQCTPAGHYWEASMLNRSQGTGCPYCSGNKAGQGNTLADLHPALATQWHPTRNDDRTPSMVTAGTTTAAWWLCEPRQHEWRASIAGRVAGRGCPQCAGKVASPEHNLAVVHPAVAALWHPTLNGDVTPAEVTPGSKTVRWWLCATAGHYWDANVVDQRQAGCPFCSGHRPGQGNTLADLHPDVATRWHATRNIDRGPHQVTPGSHEHVWCTCKHGHDWNAEVRGVVRGGQCDYCSGRLAGQGNTLADLHSELARGWHPTENDRPAGQIVATSPHLGWWRCEDGADHQWQAAPRARVDGAGCPFCGRRRPSAGHNLAALHPDLAAQWHPTKNGELTPEQLLPGSEINVWWRATCGHVWDAIVANRTHGRNGCPYCANKRVGQGNSLADLHPALAAQWHPTLNGDLTPSDVTPGRADKAW